MDFPLFMLKSKEKTVGQDFPPAFPLTIFPIKEYETHVQDGSCLIELGFLSLPINVLCYA